MPANTTTAASMWSPEQWDTASAYYKNIMSGAQPSSWLTAEKGSTSMLDPSYYDKLWDSQSKMVEDQWSNQAKGLSEKAGVGGTRYSSSLNRNIAQVGSQLYNSAYSNYLSQMLGAQQSALANLYNLGAGQSNLGMGAASGLTGIGSLQAQLPLSVAAAMGQAGQNQYNTSVNPYLSMLWGGLGNQGNTPTTYQQGWGSQLMGTLMNPQIQSGLKGLFGGGVNTTDLGNWGAQIAGTGGLGKW
jgi:hypothetical protein